MTHKSIYKRLYCRKCGSPVYVRKTSDRRRVGVCSLLCCGAKPVEWVERSRYTETAPQTFIDFDAFGAPRLIADVQKTFAEAVSIRLRDAALTGHAPPYPFKDK